MVGQTDVGHINLIGGLVTPGLLKTLKFLYTEQSMIHSFSKNLVIPSLVRSYLNKNIGRLH